MDGGRERTGNGGRVVARSRLALPADALGRLRLITITAPAGTGKTHLLRQWQAEVKAAGADGWLAASGDDLAARLDQPPPRAGLLMLDDAHRLAGTPALGRVAAWLATGPPGPLPSPLVVLAGRRALPLPLARLELDGLVWRLGEDDLRLSPAEAAMLLPPGTDPAWLAAAVEQTEGWAAGLRLAVPGAAVSGRQRAIADYLREEVLDPLPAAQRDFLLTLAPLDTFTTGQAAAASGRADAAALLETLEGAGVFLVPLDGRREVYRFRRLFRDFLLGRLAVEAPDRQPAVHAAAARWCAANGRGVEALDHARAAGDPDLLADLVATVGRTLFRRGDFKTLHGWLTAVPPALVAARLPLCLLNGWAEAYLGAFGTARAWVERAGAHPDLAPGGGAAAELAVLRGVLGVIQTDEPEIDGLALPAVLALPGRLAGEGPSLHGFAHVLAGYALRAAGRLGEAAEAFTRAAAAADAPDTALVNLLARFNSGQTYHLMGRQRTAEAVLRHARDALATRGWQGTLGDGFVRVGLGTVLREQDKLEDSLAALDGGIALLERSQAHGFLGVGLVERALTLAALGRAAEARADLDAAHHLAVAREVTRVAFRARLAEAEAALAQGDAAAAARWLDPLRTASGTPEVGGRSSEKQEAVQLAWCRLLALRGEAEAVLERTAAGLASAEASGRLRNAAGFLTVRAAVLAGLGESEAAADCLGRGLDLAGREGSLRPFLAGGPALVPVLAALASDPRRGPVAAAVLAVFPAGAGGGGGGGGSGGPLLHFRETQMLGLLAQGLRNREIAARLRLSDETVKWYLKQLYEKLAVGSRAQAVQRGRELGLLG